LDCATIRIKTEELQFGLIRPAQQAGILTLILPDAFVLLKLAR
jgi:hypothetical protein